MAKPDPEVMDIIERAIHRESVGPVRMPGWPDSFRGVPVDVVRSALFGMVRKGNRVNHTEPVLLASWADREIHFKGLSLDQRDLDVWMEILHFFREQIIEENLPRIAFHISEILDRLGKSKGGKNIDNIKDSLDRLLECTVTITNKKINKQTFKAPLISNYAFDEELSKFSVGIHSDTARMFGDNYVRVPIELRKTINGDLTKWLQLYVCSHKKGRIHSISKERLAELAGVSLNQGPKEITRTFKQSFKSLEDLEIVDFWEITRKGTISFRRPIARDFQESLPFGCE